jgi:hypothetical protein
MLVLLCSLDLLKVTVIFSLLDRFEKHSLSSRLTANSHFLHINTHNQYRKVFPHVAQKTLVIQRLVHGQHIAIMGTRGLRIVRFRSRYFVYWNQYDSYPEVLGQMLVDQIPTDPEQYKRTSNRVLLK